MYGMYLPCRHAYYVFMDTDFNWVDGIYIRHCLLVSIFYFVVLLAANERRIQSGKFFEAFCVGNPLNQGNYSSETWPFRPFHP